MSITILSSDRMFQIWKYTIGHSQLLIRSTKSPEFPSRIDVLFKGVEQFHLPATFEGLFITEASEAEIERLCTLRESVSFHKNLKVFAVTGRDYVGYVAALAVFSHEDQGEYYDPSFFAKNNIL